MSKAAPDAAVSALICWPVIIPEMPTKHRSGAFSGVVAAPTVARRSPALAGNTAEYFRRRLGLSAGENASLLLTSPVVMG